MRVRRSSHLGGILFAKSVEPEGVFAERITDLGAQDVGTLDLVQGLPILPAFAVHQLDLFGGFAPAPRRPIDIGTKPDCLAAVDITDDFDG